MQFGWAARLRRLRLLVRRSSLGARAGSQASSQRGSGLAFAEVRPYEPGDDLRHIDWHVTARHDRPFVKQFTEERDATLWLLLDCSGSMGTGGRGEVARELAALFGWLAHHQRNRIGGIRFADAVLDHQRPERSVHGYFAWLNRSAQGSTGGTRLLPAVERLLHLRGKRGQVVLIGDGRSADFAPALARLARYHEVRFVQLVRPADAELPAEGLLQLQDEETQQYTWIDASDPTLRAAYAAAERDRREKLRAACRAAKVAHLELEANANACERCIQWLEQLARPRRG